MGREIKFRGLNNSGEFEYGNLVKYRGHLEGFVTAIQVLHNDGTVNYLIPVKPESVGQFTGLKDKNGKDIYEGDIVSEIDTLNPHIKRHREILFEYGSFCVKDTPINEYYSNTNRSKWFVLEIIGNIHENPELL